MKIHLVIEKVQWVQDTQRKESEKRRNYEYWLWRQSMRLNMVKWVQCKNKNEWKKKLQNNWQMSSVDDQELNTFKLCKCSRQAFDQRLTRLTFEASHTKGLAWVLWESWFYLTFFSSTLQFNFWKLKHDWMRKLLNHHFMSYSILGLKAWTRKIFLYIKKADSSFTYFDCRFSDVFFIWNELWLKNVSRIKKQWQS